MPRKQSASADRVSLEKDSGNRPRSLAESGGQAGTRQKANVSMRAPASCLRAPDDGGSPLKGVPPIDIPVVTSPGGESAVVVAVGSTTLSPRGVTGKDTAASPATGGLQPDDWVDSEGRYVGPRWKRVHAVKRALQRLRLSLRRGMAHCPNPRPRDLDRFAARRVEIAALEAVLHELENGGSPPPSPLTGQRRATLPDRVGPKPEGV